MILALLSIGLGLITLGFGAGLWVTGFALAAAWTLFAALIQILFGWCRGNRIEAEHADETETP